jgi:PLD-like domain
MSSENFKCVGPGEALAYIRNDLRHARSSVLIIGPWLDDYFAEQLVLVSGKTLSARVLVRSQPQVDPVAWDRTMAALGTFAEYWAACECRSLDYLHAKCLQIDNQIVYVGSANWYRYSLETSLEILIRGDLNSIEGHCTELESLWDQGKSVVNLEKVGSVKPQQATGITHEVPDRLAAEVLKNVPGSFVLRKKR